ncbi:hypothetical protein ISCGN_000140 [Ixodes scapularis]
MPSGHRCRSGMAPSRCRCCRSRRKSPAHCCTARPPLGRCTSG